MSRDYEDAMNSAAPLDVTFQLDPGAIEPRKAHETDAGLDLAWYVPDFDMSLCVNDPDEYWARRDQAFYDSYVKSKGIYKLRTGVHVLIPAGYVGLVLPRSSSPVEICKTGVIDAGYTGEIFVQWGDCIGRDWEQARADIPEPHDRIAQLVILPLTSVNLIPGKVTDKETARGEGGFGSTGK